MMLPKPRFQIPNALLINNKSTVMNTACERE